MLTLLHYPFRINLAVIASLLVAFLILETTGIIRISIPNKNMYRF